MLCRRCKKDIKKFPSPHCTFCGSREHLIAYSKFTTKSGEHKASYMCRRCNTERCKEYRKTKQGKEAYRKASKKFATKNPQKIKAHKAVYWQVKTGVKTNPNKCSRCGGKGEVIAHHADYSKPLDIEWVCRPCHSHIHKSMLK